MKLFLYSILSIFLLTACSSTDDAAIEEGQKENVAIEVNSQINGTWTLEQIVTNNGTDITTNCDTQYGKITFNVNGGASKTVTETSGTACNSETIIYDDVLLSPYFRLRDYDANVEERYNASIENGKLKMTLLLTSSIGGDDPEFIETTNQITVYYSKG